jgi:hypothetical protein
MYPLALPSSFSPAFLIGATLLPSVGSCGWNEEPVLGAIELARPEPTSMP